MNFVGTTKPDTPAAGTTFYDIVSNVMRVFDGSKWIILTHDTVEELLWNECLGIMFEKEHGCYESTQ